VAQTRVAIDDFALGLAMNTNSGNFSRFSMKEYLMFNNYVMRSFVDDGPQSDTLYVMDDSVLWSKLILAPRILSLTKDLDGFRLVAS